MRCYIIGGRDEIVVLPMGFEPMSGARKALMIGRTTPREHMYKSGGDLIPIFSGTGPPLSHFLLLAWDHSRRGLLPASAGYDTDGSNQSFGAV